MQPPTITVSVAGATALMSILLIYPPAAKFCEPPAGIARLAGALRDQGVSCLTVDLNLECMLDQFDLPLSPSDTWSRRASASRSAHLAALRSRRLYRQPDRYRRAVSDLNRLLALSGRRSGCELTLANFSDPAQTPVATSVLFDAAENYRKNHFYPGFSRRLDALIAEHSPRFVGLSVSYLSQALTAFAILGYLKHRYPAVTTIAGGGLITSWLSRREPLDLARGPADHLVRGPGEQELLRLTGGGAAGPFGRADYSGFRLKSYLSPGMILPYAASDGCYWRKCSFCPDRAEETGYRQIPPATVSRELADLTRRHTPVLLHFLDNAMSPALLRELALSPPTVPWYGFTRFERLLEDSDFCRALKRAGCVMLKLGLESGSPKVLEQMNKGIDLDRVSKILANLRRAGIATYVYLLFGTPAETEADAVMTMDYVRTQAAAITFLNLALFNMPVGSPEARDCPDRFSAGDLSLYCDFGHPHGWDRKAVRAFLQTRFRRDSLISRIIKRDPPFFTSNHAPLFCLAGPDAGSAAGAGSG